MLNKGGSFILTLALSREAATDELLGRVVVGKHAVSIYRRAGAVLHKMSARDLPWPRLRQLPPPPEQDASPLLDFDIEQAAIQSLLRSNTPPVIEVSGPLGSGKTALVQRIPGTLYVDAGGLGYRAFLQRLYERAFCTDGVYVPDVDALRAIFERWRTPVVIDDFQGSIAELHSILEILARVPVIYTTVDPLQIEPSAEFRLSGLRPDTAYTLFERYYGASIAGEYAVMELVSIYLEGNPLMIAQAGSLARAGRLAALQGPEPLAAAVFNSMTIREQQILATIAGYKGARPDRASVIAVSGTKGAAFTINALLARHTIETDGEYLWLSPLMAYPVEAVLPSLIRYDAMFAYADSVLSKKAIPCSVIDNPTPYLVTLQLAASRGCYEQVMRNGRALADALFLGGSIQAARDACELVRDAANELEDQTLRAWAQHQIGALTLLAGNREEAAAYFHSAAALRGRIGDDYGKACSQKNLALLPRDRMAPRRKRKHTSDRLGDFITIVCAMVLAAVAVLGYAANWLPAKELHAHARAHVSAHVQSASVQPPAYVPLSKPAVTVTAPLPRIVQFTAIEQHIAVGQSTTLCFKMSNVKIAFLDPLGPLNLVHSGCVTVSPRADTSYTLYAYNQTGVASTSVEVKVLPAEGN